jgi:hypothetical protein
VLAGLGSRCTHRLERMRAHDAAPTRYPYHQKQWELCNAFSAVYDRLPFASRKFHLQLLEKSATGQGKDLNARHYELI